MVTKTFYSKAAGVVEGPPLVHVLSKIPTKGEIGLEIEVEGNKFEKEDVPAPWMYVKDGSLRGKDNAEYVLAAPIPFAAVPVAVSTLWEMFEKTGSKLDVSNRTSVHVHLNVQTWHLNRLTVFCAMFLACEEILVEWCGEHRVGNLFCLRAKDAYNIVSELKRFIQKDGGHQFYDGMHYANLNVGALWKFGSLEIRAMRGVNDPETILDWVAILQRMYEVSAEFSDPRALVADFSGGGPMAFLERVLGDKVDIIRNGVGYSPEKVKASLYEGIRLAQDLCYCRDWNLYKPIELTKDPFGRVRNAAGVQVQYTPPAVPEPEYDDPPEDDYYETQEEPDYEEEGL